MKLTKLGKIIFTILFIMMGLLIYNHLGIWGELAKQNKFYEMITFLGWFWMVCQLFVFSKIWEK